MEREAVLASIKKALDEGEAHGRSWKETAAIKIVIHENGAEKTVGKLLERFETVLAKYRTGTHKS